MPQITRNSGFTTQDIVTATKLHNLVDTAVISKELLTAQTLMVYGTIAPNDYLLGYDVSDTSMRTMSVENILNSKIESSLGTTSVNGWFGVLVNGSGGAGEAEFKINSALNDGTISAEGFDETLIDSETITFESNNVILKDSNEKKVLEYKYWTAATVNRKKGDVTIDITHLSTEDPDSKTYITTDSKTVLKVNGKSEFVGETKHTGDLRLMSSIVKIGEGEDEETVDLKNPPAMGLYDVVFDSFDQSTFNVRAADTSASGFTVFSHTITVPDDEVWFVKYEALVGVKSQDPYKIVIKKGVVDSFIYDYYDPSSEGADDWEYSTVTASFRLTTGTYTLEGKGSFTTGSNSMISVFGRGGIQRTISKIRV